MIKYLLVVLIAILLFLQYRLWFEKDGVRDTVKLEHAIASQQQTNHKMLIKNKALRAETKNLKHGKEAIEDRAREQLGMIKKGEQFYQIVSLKENMSYTTP